MQAIADISRMNYQPWPLETFDTPWAPRTERELELDRSKAKSKFLFELSKAHNSFIETVHNFQKRFGNSVHSDDPIYTRFIDLIKVVLANSGKNLYEDAEFDSNMVYIVAILGLLHPTHISCDIDIKQVLSECLWKHKQSMIDRAIEMKVHGEDIANYVNTTQDTLYYYLLYVLYQEDAECYSYQYFRNKNLHYR